MYISELLCYRNTTNGNIFYNCKMIIKFKLQPLSFNIILKSLHYKLYLRFQKLWIFEKKKKLKRKHRCISSDLNSINKYHFFPNIFRVNLRIFIPSCTSTTQFFTFIPSFTDHPISKPLKVHFYCFII